MIRSRVNVSSAGFIKVTEAVERKARQSVQAAAEEAAVVAQSAASIDLELEVRGPRGTEEGFAAGIRSNKRGWRGVRIARFFDDGTLAERKRPLKRKGRDHWPVKRKSGSYTAHRQDITAGMGIPAERFFTKARAAGRKRLLETLRRGA